MLGLEEVGAHDNFFDLGGHSLLTIRVQGLIQERLSRRLPITELFRFPTVRALADSLGQEPTDAVAVTAETSHRRAEIRRQSLATRRRRGHR